MVLITVVALILILGVIIFVHELGHFLTARLFGFKVDEFAFGFGPRIFKRQSKQTLFSVNAFPLGGYVKLHGEGQALDDSDSFETKPILHRAAVVLAGVAMNLILAWLVLSFWYLLVIVQPPDNSVIVGRVIAGGSAQAAGIQAGDLLVQGDSVRFEHARAVAEFTRSHTGQTVELVVRRFGKDVVKRVKLGDDPTAPLGLAPIDLVDLPEGLEVGRSSLYALQEVTLVIKANSQFIGQLVTGIFSRAPAPVGEVAGPVGIYGYLSQMVSIGPIFVLRFSAILSLVVAFFNILPIPALDGGRLFFILIEGLAGRKLVRQQIEQAVHAVGFVFLVGLILLVTYQDIAKLIGSRL